MGQSIQLPAVAVVAALLSSAPSGSSLFQFVGTILALSWTVQWAGVKRTLGLSTTSRCLAFQRLPTCRRLSSSSSVKPPSITLQRLASENKDVEVSGKVGDNYIFDGYDDDDGGIQHVDPQPWSAMAFSLSNAWGNHPLLLRQSFLKDITSDILPSWEEIIELACQGDEEDVAAVPSRLIAQAKKGKIDSYELFGFGPFGSQQGLDQMLNTTELATSFAASTLVVNDVDRFIPELSDWMDQKFGTFIPRWRRDDAQVSLANCGGGIGPHVDNYDVFLIQVSGTRIWEVGVDFRVSAPQESTHLIDECSERGVRILNISSLIPDAENDSTKTVKIRVKPGDCLYLPPRVMHCGTATSNRCMTLSVGCRAPSAADMVAKLSETLLQGTCTTASLEAVQRRYIDSCADNKQDDMTSPASSFVSPEIKQQLKGLVLTAVQEALESDEEFFDSLVGKLLTEPNRRCLDASAYPVPLYSMDAEWREELGVWGNARTAVGEALVKGNGCLRRTEGVAFAWSYQDIDGSRSKYRVYAHGYDPVELTISTDSNQDRRSMSRFMNHITNGAPMTQAVFDDIPIEKWEADVIEFLVELLDKGWLYGDDI